MVTLLVFGFEALAASALLAAYVGRRLFSLTGRVLNFATYAPANKRYPISMSGA